MPSVSITSIRFNPPAAIARLGGSPTPVEAYSWGEDPQAFGAGQTVISPRVSFEVLADGAVEPYVPGEVRFKDGDLIRPVCPFFELEAEVKRGGAEAHPEPLTHTLLRECEVRLNQLTFSIIAANRKAVRRTSDPACGFEARLRTTATNHSRIPLLAWTHVPSGPALVSREKPVPLGFFQVIRPVVRPCGVRGVNTDVIRVRFTPGTGQVYGPPGAVKSQTTDSRRPHLIVPPENRILNPLASWINYDYTTAAYPPPRPADTYDGESDVDQANAAWGVVDDTCDGVITATLALPSTTLSASARVFVGPPDYAPDRRPFYAISDDLADRDPESLAKNPKKATPGEWHDAVSDLFRRAFEVASIVNLERCRSRQIQLNTSNQMENVEGFPDVHDKTMTPSDKVEGRQLLSVIGGAELSLGDTGAGIRQVPNLPRNELAKMRHEELAQPEVVLPMMLEQRERISDVLRRPFARFSELPEKPKQQTPFEFRDPRIRRSYAFDARMPPYMRDCDEAPVSLTRLQWDLLFPNGLGKEETPTEAKRKKAAMDQLKPRVHARQLKPRRGR